VAKSDDYYTGFFLRKENTMKSKLRKHQRGFVDFPKGGFGQDYLIYRKNEEEIGCLTVTIA
jgi:hypothetical protein